MGEDDMSTHINFNKLYIIVCRSYIYMIHFNTINKNNYYMQKQLGQWCEYFLTCLKEG